MFSRPLRALLGERDDMVQNDTVAEAVKSYCGEGGTLEVQKDVAGNLDNEEKCLIYSPSGDLDCVPPFMVGSPHHRDENGNLTGREAFASKSSEPTSATQRLPRRRLANASQSCCVSGR